MVSPTIPGQVTIDKYAVPVPGLVNTWDVTLRIDGMETAKSSDIVLVIDRSGSMEGTKLSGAMTAAKAFVSSLADDPNTRISLVSFASAYESATTVTTHTGLLNVNIAANRTTLNNAINSLVALGGTNTQAGIRAASQVLATSTADYKNIVLLSDGQPTQSYRINDVLTKLEAYGQDETVESGGGTYTAYVANRTRSNLLAADYDYTATRGYGSAAYTRIGDSGQNYYSHGNSAIAQAAMFKSLGADRILWTIALETTAYGNSVLESIASPGKDFTAQTSDLNTIFLQIAGSINAAARDITVDDPMGLGFEIPAANVGDIVVSQGSATYIGGVISWNVGDLFKPISAGSNIKYAEMTYRVSITDDILALPVPLDGKYPTNGDADVTYKDSNGATQTVDFPIPKVNPIFLKVKKTLLDAAGTEILDPARSFDIRIKSDNTDGDVIYPEYDHIYTLIPGQSIIKTNLRLADIYTVSETATDYEITIKVNGTVVSTFEVLPPAGIPLADTGQNDIEVEVINKEKPLGKLILKKVLMDENDVLILNDTREFTFTITGPETPGVFDGEETRTLKGGDTVTIEGLRYGTYTVVETDPGLGFTVTSVPMDGKATLAWNSKEGTVTITNKYVSPPRDVVAKKIWENGPEEDHVPVTLTLYRQIGLNPKEEVTGVTPVIVPAAGPATEFVYTWSNLPKTDVHGVEYIYTVDELVIPTGYDKSISDDGLTVTNKRKVSSLQLLKLNVAGAPLQGAEFELYRKVTETEPGAILFEDENGDPLYGIKVNGTLITGADGKSQIIADLEIGEYFVIETKAPVGYYIHKHPIEFSIVATLTLNVIEITNELAPIIPLTGGMGTWLFTILGVGLMGGALFGITKSTNKSKGKEESKMKGRKLFSILMTFLMLFVYVLPVTASADPVPVNTTDVTIHKLELFSDFTPVKHNGTKLDETALNGIFGSGNYKMLPGVVFSYWIVTESDTLEDLNDDFAADLLGPPHGVLAATNSNGEVFIDNLPDGYYYFRETFTPANVTKQIAVPFILGLPVMNAAGTDYISDLHIYPKNLTVRGAVVLTKYAGQMGLPGAKFKLFEGEPTTGTWYDPEGPEEPKTFTTDRNGWIWVNNLPVGKYYFVEVEAPAPYLLNNTPIPFEITKNGNVVVTYNESPPDLKEETGVVEHVSLDNFIEPDISKSVIEIGAIKGSGDYHEPLDFFLNIVLPADILGYDKLEVTDMIDTKLDYKGTLVVEGSSDGTNFTALVDPDQYDVVNEPAPDGDGLLKIAFVPEKLKNVAGATLTHLRISFKAAINKTAIMGDAIVNKAMVYYNNGTVDGDDESNEVKVYTGGKNFIKLDSKTEDPLAGAEFAVQNGAGQFLKIGVNGEFIWVATLAETTFRLISGADGKFEIEGLQYNLTTGTTYFLVETKAPMSSMGYPYNLIKDPIPFVVNATSYYTDPTEIKLGSDPATAMPMTVLNILGPQIPQTGGIGTMLFTLIGGGLMGSAVLLNKKRTRK